MTDAVVRQAVAVDAAAVSDVVHRAYQHHVARIGRRPAPMDADYPALIERRQVWVADAAGELLGVLVLVVESDHLLLENIAVSPAAQGRGIGALLLETADRQAVACGLPEVRLYTNAAMTENLEYYPRRGFVETGRATQDGFSRVFFVKSMQLSGQADPGVS